MTDFDPLTWQQIMAIDAEDGEPKKIMANITALFPYGAVKVPGKGRAEDRYRAASDQEDADVSLRKILKAKKERLHTTRIPHRDSTKGYASTDEMALGAKTPRGIVKGRQQEPEPESLTEWEQRLMTEKANEDWKAYVEKTRPEQTRREVSRQRVNKLRKLEREATSKGVDLTDILEDAVEQSKSRIVDHKEAA